MISGRQTLLSIDQMLDTQRTRLGAVEDRIEASSTSLVELQQADARDYRDLARTRVDALGGGELAEHIDQTERQVLGLLKDREAASRALAERLEASEHARVALEAERKTHSDALDRAAETVDAAEARTQARLDADPDYRIQREHARERQRTAMHADEKAASSAQEKDQKGESYRGDPLFMYLWARRYGTSAYKANPLARWLDGKVARLIGFADARANYARLNEIPERLREHADALETEAEAAFRALEAVDSAAREADGIPALDAELARRQGALSAIDQRIETAETARQGLLAEKAAFAAGEDAHSRRAVEYLAAELQREDLMALRREALATPFPDDDLIVARLLEREDERRRLEASVRSLADTLDQHRTRLDELQAVRADVKRHGYDRAGSTFKDGALVALMLGNFLDGMLDRRALWKVLREQQRYQPQHSDPGFGSGGLGRGTVWGGGLGGIMAGGLGRGAGRGDRGGGSRGGGRGGFRTGGGF